MAFFDFGNKEKPKKEESRVEEFLRTEKRNVVSFGEESGLKLPKQDVMSVESPPAEPPIKKKITVEEIHHSFLTAMDALLSKEGILVEQKEDADALRLYELGFSSVEKIKKEKEKADVKKMEMSVIELTKYYDHHYPQNKFITDEQLNKICKQFNLVIGEPRDYKGDIPDRCVKEIANFKLAEKDELIMSQSGGSWNRRGSTYFALDVDKKGTGEPTEVTVPQFLKMLDKFIAKTNRNEYWQADLRELKNYIQTGKTKYIGSHEEYRSLCGGLHDTVGTNKNFLKVVAPIDMMDMTNKRVDEQNRIVENVKDPIVLCPVKGGNLIISLWGAESEIDELKNPKLN